MKKRKASWTTVRAELQNLDSDELIDLMKGLYDRTDENRCFVEARLAIGDGPLIPFKKRIEEALYPDPIHGPPISIAAARKAVSDYRAASGDPEGLLDLMLYYVECGTEMTLDYGDMDEAFYSSLEFMFDRAIKQLEGSEPGMVATYLPRAVRIVRRAEGLGWGYYDCLAARLSGSFPDASQE